jgi:hypothetical protein
MEAPMLRRFVAALAAGAVVWSLAGCGCGKQSEASGPIRQLRQTRLRFSTAEQEPVCYIVAEIQNTGTKAVREVEVTATLLSGSGKSRGLNRIFLHDIKPGEKQLFRMKVTTTGPFRRVELSFKDPRAKG